MPASQLCIGLGLLLAVNLTFQEVLGDVLLVSKNNSIWSLNTASPGAPPSPQLLLSADLPVRAFDIHLAWRQVYWATHYTIYRTPLYDLRTTTLVAVTGKVDALVVDWINHRLYWAWTDDWTEASRIESAQLDGTARRVVYEAPRAITTLALDPQIGKIFWFEFIKENQELNQIKSGNLDGSNIKTLYSNESIFDHTPLALDLAYRNLYFYKAVGNYSEMWELNYDGLKPVIKLFNRKEPPARSLSITKQGFFYSNGHGIIEGNWTKRYYDLVVGGDVYRTMVLEPVFKPVIDSLGEVCEMRVWSDYSQPRSLEPCRSQRCEQQCVPQGRHTRCLCDYGLSLAHDLLTCYETDGYILFSTKTLFGRYLPNGDHPMILYNDSLANIHAFDVHFKSKTIYWSDLYYGNIYRAPVDNPTRKEVVISGVAAYGVAVDWVHDHLYWTDHSRLMVSSLDGTHRIILLKNLDDPADIAVDPINRFIFWAECGYSQSIQRAALDGSDVSQLMDHVTCGANLVPDSAGRMLFWVEWGEGTGVGSCGLGGSRCGVFYPGTNTSWMAVSLLDYLLESGLWTPPWAEPLSTPSSVHGASLVKLNERELNIEAKVLMKSSMQPPGLNVCEETDCPGLCMPSPTGAQPLCLCEGKHHHGHPCHEKQNATMEEKDRGRNSEAYLEVLSYSPFSLTVQCTGSLRTHPVLQPYIYVTEVASLVPRPQIFKRDTRSVHVFDKSLPFIIDELNPATTYNLSVRNRVTKNSFSLEVHTPPPPLRVTRLPVLYLPGVTDPVPWRPQGVHLSSPNLWEDLLDRTDLYLLLLSRNKISPDNGNINSTLLELLEGKITDHFIILYHYKTKEQFDDDPTLYLGNVPWGQELKAAMVQVTWYKGVANLDIVFSEGFYLPDPQWTPLIQEIKQAIQDSDFRVRDS